LLHQRRADGDYWQHKCLGELTETNFKVVNMHRRATRTPPVGDEFRDDFGHGFTGHVGWMLLFVELPHFGKGHVLWQTRAGGGVVAHDLHQPGGIGIADAFVFGEQREGLFERHLDGADGGGRTHTLSRVPDFESGASANSATSATNKINAFAVSPLSFFPLHPAIAPRRFQPCNPYGINNRVPGNARNTCQTMASGARFRKCRICFNTLSAETTLGKLKLTARTIRKSLQTTVWSTAQLRLNDFLKEHRENRNNVDPPKFKEAVELFKTELEAIRQ
jgi:hypothetical protein